MSLCACGNEIENDGALCARCAALQTLELKPEATDKQISEAFRLLAKVWHPDRFQADPTLAKAAGEKLKVINSAYSFLNSRAGRKQQHRKPRPSAPDRAQPAAPSDYASSAPAAANPIGRPSRPSIFTMLATLGVAQRLLVLVCGVSAGGLSLKFIDYQLASDPSTAAIYSTYRASVAQQIATPARKFWENAQQNLHKLASHPSASASTLALPPAQISSSAKPAQTPTAQPAPLSAHQPSHTAARTAHLLPFITVGLTKDEVIAVEGAPTASADDKLTYKSSEIFFKDGKVTGWKIDPAAPIRVKLWPDAPVDTDLSWFSVGSTRNQVLIVQGTPTTLADDKFAYGNSEIFFRNNRVVNWKSDPASVALRAVNR
jgi:curved DNA-binding protein CbpA